MTVHEMKGQTTEAASKTTETGASRPPAAACPKLRVRDRYARQAPAAELAPSLA